MWKINDPRWRSMKTNGPPGRRSYRPSTGIKSLASISASSGQAEFKLAPVELSIMNALREHGRLSKVGIADLIPYSDRTSYIWLDFILDRLEKIGKIKCIDKEWYEAI